MKSPLILLFFCVVALETHAQRRITVIDMDTDLPVKGVSVKVGKERAAETDYLGRADIPMVFDSITFNHVQYEHERLAYSELPGDTMYLLPKEHLLPEVSITELDPRVKSLVSGWAQQGAMQGAAMAPRGNITYYFDFADILDRRGRRDKKHLERAKKILKEWDEK